MLRPPATGGRQRYGKRAAPTREHHRICERRCRLLPCCSLPGNASTCTRARWSGEAAVAVEIEAWYGSRWSFPKREGEFEGPSVLRSSTAGARKTATSAPLQLPREPQHQLHVRIRRRLKPLRSLLETPMRMAVMTSPHQRLGLLDRYLAESQ